MPDASTLHRVHQRELPSLFLSRLVWSQVLASRQLDSWRWLDGGWCELLGVTGAFTLLGLS